MRLSPSAPFLNSQKEYVYMIGFLLLSPLKNGYHIAKIIDDDEFCRTSVLLLKKLSILDKLELDV